MIDPKPANLLSDDELRAQGWSAVSRDEDGHAMSVVARSRGREVDFRAWLAEQVDLGLTVRKLQ